MSCDTPSAGTAPGATPVPTGHMAVQPSSLYVASPVMLLATLNPDGTPNLAPASSYWALGSMACLGLEDGGQPYENLQSRPEITINFPSPQLLSAVGRLAGTTGRNPVPAAKAAHHRYVHDKFGEAGLTPEASELVDPPRVAECMVQMEAAVRHDRRGVGAYHIVEVEVLRVWAAPQIVADDGTNIASDTWQPCLDVFRRFYGVDSATEYRLH